MSFIDNLKLKNKLILMLIFPLAGLAYFSVNGTFEKYGEAREMGKLRVLTGLAVRISALVHELQKERGLTAGYMNSGGVRFSAETAAQRTETDREAEGLRESIGGVDIVGFGTKFTAAMDGALSALEMIQKRRGSADSLKVPEEEIFDYYSKMIGSFLDTIFAISALSTNSEESIMTFGYVNLLQAKERTAMERGFMNGVFTAGRFAPGEFNRFSSLVAEEGAYINVFLSVAPEGQRSFYRAKMRGRFVEESEKMKKAAFERANESLGVDPAYWWEMMTGKIELLKEVEDRISRDIDGTAVKFRSAAQSEFIFYIALTVFMAAAAAVLSYIIARSIIRPLNEMAAASRKLSTGDLNVSVEAGSNDEVGALANAFKEMLSYLKGMADTMDAIKKGDPRVRVTPASERDMLGNAFKDMAEALKERETRLRSLLKVTDMDLIRTSRYKTDFLARISHELKTPLTHVMGFSELLATQEKMGLSEAGRKYVDNIYRSGKDLLGLINPLLEFTRRGGKEMMDIKEFDFQGAVEEAVAGVRTSAGEKRQTLRVNVDKGVKLLMADRAMFIQMLHNLLDNAVKYTPSGGTVELKVWQDIYNGEKVLRVRVRDTGIGIKPELKGKLFDIFEVGDGTSTREYGGMGIGLALTKRFVEFHGGKIWAESKAGKGSTFEFFIPAGRA
ncbi:MAG TPA: nitrate- and nitrite sensing domain-containing protein [Thermodesulfobacteriota bacterium]|nr:nitrate- and nitrite sensing domain-containing protein [Thermodesulfobacteriota bacterium]